MLGIQVIAHFHRRQHALHLFALLVFRFRIDFQEAREKDDLAGSDELLGTAFNGNGHRGLFGLGITHLGGDRALPDQLIEMLGKGVARNSLTGDVRRTDGLVCLLSTLGLGDILAGFGVILAILVGHDFVGDGKRHVRQVHGVGTHVGDVTGFVELLSDNHRLRHGKAELAGRLLLQSGGGERRRRTLLARGFLNSRYLERSLTAVFQEGNGLLLGRETFVQLRIQLDLLVTQRVEHAIYLV